MKDFEELLPGYISDEEKDKIAKEIHSFLLKYADKVKILYIYEYSDRSVGYNVNEVLGLTRLFGFLEWAKTTLIGRVYARENSRMLQSDKHLENVTAMTKKISEKLSEEEDDEC